MLHSLHQVDTWFPWYMNDAPVVEDRRAVVEYNHQHINQLGQQTLE